MPKNMNTINYEQEIRIKPIITTTIIIILMTICVFSSFYIISPGERGVLMTLGKTDPTAKGEGFHWKAPIIQKVVKIDVKTQKYETGASAASKDLQVVSTNLAVNYHLVPESVVRIYQELGLDYESKVIQPAVQEVVKASTAKSTAEKLITKREGVKALIDEGLRTRLQDKGIIVETTSLTDFDFSAQFNQAIEMKVTAEQNALTEKNRLAQIEYQAQQKIAEAEGNSKSQILLAEAQAKQKLLVAESEAKALELQKTQITDKMLELRRIEVQKEYAERWDGRLPVYNLGSNTLPVMNIPTQTIAAVTTTKNTS